jgi:hypothetical protein
MDTTFCILNDWAPDLEITPDMVIHGQGADPAIIRRRNPKLYETAVQAIQVGIPLLQSFVWIKSTGVTALENQRILLADGFSLNGEGLVNSLGKAEIILLGIYSIGNQLEIYGKGIWETDPLLSLALDGLGTIAIDQLAAKSCNRVQEHFSQNQDLGFFHTSPGGSNWPLETGQKEIFNYLNPPEEKVRVLSGGQMTPKKSISMAIGIGTEIKNNGKPCESCSRRDHCLYKSRKLITYV